MDEAFPFTPAVFDFFLRSKKAELRYGIEANLSISVVNWTQARRGSGGRRKGVLLESEINTNMTTDTC